MTEIDYTKMDGPQLLAAVGSDAMKWATAFCQHQPDCGIDESVMVTWFANAIMNDRDTRDGVIHNGDHMQYLIDNGLSPLGA